jgi:hypothetical protein
VGKFLQNGPNGGNIPNRKCLWDFSPYGKNNPVGFFSPMGFFMGQLMGVKTPPKSHGILF